MIASWWKRRTERKKESDQKKAISALISNESIAASPLWKGTSRKVAASAGSSGIEYAIGSKLHLCTASYVRKHQLQPFLLSSQMNSIIQFPNQSHCQQRLPAFEAGIIKLIIIIQREVEGTFHRIQATHHAWTWQQQQRRKPKVKTNWKKLSPHNLYYQ